MAIFKDALAIRYLLFKIIWEENRTSLARQREPGPLHPESNTLTISKATALLRHGLACTKVQLREKVENGKSQPHNNSDFVIFTPERRRKPECKAVRNILPHPRSDWALNQKQQRPRLNRSQQVVRSCRSRSGRASSTTPVHIYWHGSLQRNKSKITIDSQIVKISPSLF